LEIGDVHARAGELAVGTRQRIEILKSLAGGARVLILDEPTAVLTPQESAQLFIVLRRLRAEGRLILFITHKLQEVRAIADQVTVLRQGKVVAPATPATISDTELAVMMVGEPPHVPTRARRTSERELLCVDEVGLEAGAAGVSVRLHAGEVLGIVGVDGN